MQRPGMSPNLVILCSSFRVFEHRDLIGGRQDPMLQELGAKQRVDHCRFPTVELADDNKKERFVQADKRIFQKLYLGHLRDGILQERESFCEYLLLSIDEIIDGSGVAQQTRQKAAVA